VKKILIVEDNEMNMYLMRFLLKSKGYQVIEAETGEKGVELAMRENPDIVLMDIQLPGIDGNEAIKRIRESDSNKNCIIVAVTSYAMTGDMERILKAGSNGYIEKPINPETFLSEIEKFLI
jgi:two-component system cell cycle response regulator DivK